MRLLLDMQGAQSQSRHRGIGRYTLDLANALLTPAIPRLELHFAFNAGLNDAVDSIITDLTPHAGAAHRLYYKSLANVSFFDEANDARRWAAETTLAYTLEQSGADAVWYSSVIEGYEEDVVIPARPLSNARTIATLYDLIPLHNPGAYLDHPRVRQWYDARVKALTQCDLLLAISDWTRSDAINRLGMEPSRVVSIGAGVNPKFRQTSPRPPLAESTARTLGIRGPFVLYNGGFDPRKNVSRLIEAFARLPGSVGNRHQLVIVGRTSTEQMAALMATVRKTGVQPSSVIFTGHVSDEVLIDLYGHCALFVFPSTMEGFGLPPLEAMSCGAAVIASNAASLPEVIGCDEAVFDPTDVESIAEKMREGLDNPMFASYLREHGKRQAARFSWQGCAARAKQAIEELMCRPRVHSCNGGTRPRLKQSLLCIYAGTPPTWVQAISTSTPCDTVELPENLNQIDAALHRRLDEAHCIAYASTPDVAWRMGPWMRIWPGVLVIDHALSTKSAGTFEERYRAGGYSACINNEALIPLQADERCLGIVLGEGCTLPAASIEQSVPFESFSPTAHTDRLLHCLETWGNTSTAMQERRLLAELTDGPIAQLDDDDLADLSDTIVTIRSPSMHRRWLVDVSQIVRHDIGTGVQRVVRSILRQWLQQPPDGVRIEPVALVDGHYRFARRYTLELLGLDVTQLIDDFVAPVPGDLYIGLDWTAETISAAEPLLQEWHRLGVSMHFVVHDLLPLSLPEAFHPFSRELFLQWLRKACCLADVLHCVSRATATELTQWLASTDLTYQFGQPPAVRNFHLGVEITAPSDSPGELPASLARAMTSRRSLLMVGTLEPRKAHAQALDAMEGLWARGYDINLVIVGRQGWLVEELVRRIEHHGELNQRLFWLHDVDDPTLETIYSQASALLAPSLGEGFGLPLVEAAHRNLPVIARDLPVFREIMGDYPSYFGNHGPDALAEALVIWLSTPPARSAQRNWANWAQSALALAETIQESEASRVGVQTVV